MITRHHQPSNGQGWRLALKQCFDPDTLVKGRRPLVIVPGYGMNTFILGFHPTGLSMEAFLVQAGFEVWSINLRGQGDSTREGGESRYGFRELALVDLPCALEVVLRECRTGAVAADLIGCSLGASIVYAYLAHHLSDHKAGSVVSMGGPLRWDKVHPAVRLIFTSPRLAGVVPIRGTRRLARLAIPLAVRVPPLLSIYMNVDQIDLSQADQLVRTVEDPNRRLNRQIGRWIHARDLVVGGVNVTDALGGLKGVPILCVLANGDGIVPPEAALSVARALPAGEDGRQRVDILKVGTDKDWFAHADLFISRLAQEQVFAPLADWLIHRPS